jgi:hypothetical protein
MNGQNDALLALQRYCSIAEWLRTHFWQLQDSQDFKQKRGLSTNDFLIYLLSPPACLWLLWCGMLFAVVEGYRELQLEDPKVDQLLNQAGRVDVLRRCRNGAFHFQKDYFDDRFMAAILDLLFSQWAIDLTMALARCIENEIEAKGPSAAPQIDPNIFPRSI